MARLAIRRYRYFEVSRIEIDRAGPTYTIDTIQEMKNRFGPSHEFYFITGWDSLKQLPLWRDAGALVPLCRLVAVPRPGVAAPDVASLEAAIPGIAARLMLLDRPRVDISSTEVRERVARGESIAGLVPRAVEGYIRAHGLYREG
jgi:nicotinate-nucleotide adenylyltransferase